MKAPLFFHPIFQKRYYATNKRNELNARRVYFECTCIGWHERHPLGNIVMANKIVDFRATKELDKNEYDQKLETHKAQLKAQSDVEIEQLKSRLNIAATEHQITFANLHEKRAEVIAERYSLLKILVSKLYDYIKIYEMSDDLPKEQRRELAIEAFQKFRDYHQSKIIFVPAETAEKLNKIQTELASAFNEFVYRVERGHVREPDAGDLHVRFDHREDTVMHRWIKIVERVGRESSVALGDLENDFRRLLGERP